jgi:glycine cleavage system aminomethyltransferase T
MPVFRQTPLFHVHEQAGASLIEHNGWHVPAYFTSTEAEAEQLLKAAGLSDLSWMTKLDIKGYGLKTPPEMAVARAWCLGSQHYLITCEPPNREIVTCSLLSFPTSRDLSLPPPVYVTDVTSVYAQFLLAGPRAGPRSREILRKLTSLNVYALENLGCGQAGLANARSMVLRDDIQGTLAFHIVMGREYGESVWEAFLDAGHEFRLAPFGLAALKLMLGAA